MKKNNMIVLNDNILLQEHDGTASCLYNKRTETVLELNEIGTEIIKELKKPVLLEILIKNLANKYLITPEKVENDISDFIDECIGKGFLIYKE